MTRLLGFRFYKDAFFFFLIGTLVYIWDILSYICMYDRRLGCSPFVHTQCERSRYFFVTTISFISRLVIELKFLIHFIIYLLYLSQVFESE